MAYGVNAPFGLSPVLFYAGSTWNGALTDFPIYSTYGTSIFTNDPVIPLNNGSIGIGVAGSVCTGVFAGCQYVDAATGLQVNSPYWPAGTATLGGIQATAKVYADPNAIFEIQTNSGVGLTFANINENANFVAGAGNVRTGISGFMLDQATSGPGNAGYNLKIKELSRDPRNLPVTPAGAAQPYNAAYVTINNHTLRPGTAGI